MAAIRGDSAGCGGGSAGFGGGSAAITLSHASGTGFSSVFSASVSHASESRRQLRLASWLLVRRATRMHHVAFFRHSSAFITAATPNSTDFPIFPCRYCPTALCREDYAVQSPGFVASGRARRRWKRKRTLPIIAPCKKRSRTTASTWRKRVRSLSGTARSSGRPVRC